MNAITSMVQTGVLGIATCTHARHEIYIYIYIYIYSIYIYVCPRPGAGVAFFFVGVGQLGGVPN